jgi:hypothetical protein
MTVGRVLQIRRTQILSKHHAIHQHVCDPQLSEFEGLIQKLQVVSLTNPTVDNSRPLLALLPLSSSNPTAEVFCTPMYTKLSSLPLTGLLPKVTSLCPGVLPDTTYNVISTLHPSR